MLPFYLWIISFPTNHCPQSLDTEKSYCKNFSQVQTISQGKEREEKRKYVCYWERGLEKGMECQWATESWDPWWRQGRHLVLCFLQGYAHLGLCCDASLCSFSCHSLCSSLLFREAIGGAITQKADTTAILSTLCPLHVRFVILQQGQSISSDRCLRVLRVLTRSNLSMGFCFTG